MNFTLDTNGLSILKVVSKDVDTEFGGDMILTVDCDNGFSVVQGSNKLSLQSNGIHLKNVYGTVFLDDLVLGDPGSLDQLWKDASGFVKISAG